ncbi:glycerol-3-phosphate acyltransferase, partial [Arthrospira platensis SPKY1]|nr:glycerol-3-phosphate acyltransferase [Arthrospira platensis SPKY1]
MVEILISLLIAYLLGSIPTAVWVGKWFYGVDVREHGSGNAGATNTIRVLGLKAGVPVIIIDVLKGYLAVVVARYFSLMSGALEPS